MTPTLADARAQVFGLLDVGLDGVDAAYDHEPTGETTGPVYVTVAFFRLTPTDIVEAVRIYSQMADSPTDAAERLEVAIASVDDRLKDSAFGPSQCEAEPDDGLGAYVARFLVDVPRQTF